MAWKTEKWLSEVFPGEDRIYSEYRELSRRELAIVAAAVLDVALAELLSKRLLDLPKEYEDFLGLDEDGRAPAAAFGARIQLALLLGVITDRDASRAAIYLLPVYHPPICCVARFTELAVADLVSR